MAKGSDFTTADECPKCGALSYQGGYCFGCGTYRPSKRADALEREDLDASEFMKKTFGPRVGYDEVILTPRSGDRGRDVIAIKRGVGCIRIIDSVKAYKPSHLVRHDDVRALAGVLHGDLKASKGIVTTTSDFAPGIATDPYLAPLMPFRLELMNGERLKKWLSDLSK